MKTLAGIYARVSLEEQAANYSLSSQTRACKKLATEKGYATSDATIFVDEGGLGGEIDRIALSRLRDAARAGIIGAVIVHDPDRLSRKLAHLLLLTEEFERAGVPLLFVNGGIEATHEGKLFLSLRGAFSEFEKLKFAERVSRGRKEKAQQGHRVAGRPPYGYRYEGKQQGKQGELVIDEAQAATVRRIFEMSARGSTPLDIARALDRDGVPTTSGVKWSKGTIAPMLTRRVYIGEAFYNRKEGVEPKRRRKLAPAGQSKKTSARLRDSSLWIPVTVPAIVDRALFERVQKARKRAGALANGRPSREYLLRGLMKCGICGRACYHYPNRGRAFVKCGNFDRLTGERNCPGPRFWVADVESTVKDEVNAWLLDPDKWMEQVNADQKRRASAQRGSATEQRKLTAEIEKLRKREQRAAQSLLDSELSDSAAIFRADLKATQAKRRELEARARELSVTPLPMSTKESFIRFVQPRLKDFHTNPRPVIEQCVEAVVLKDGGDVDIRFRFEPDPNDGGVGVINRKSSQPYTRACYIACPRNLDSSRTRGNARARPSPADYRISDGVNRRSAGWIAPGALVHPRHAGSQSAGHPAAGVDRDQLGGIRFFGGTQYTYDPAVRLRAVDHGGLGGFERDAEVCRWLGRIGGPSAKPPVPYYDRSRARSGACCGRRIDGAQFLRARFLGRRLRYHATAKPGNHASRSALRDRRR
jgi:site-specific DNA recombinase